jgi:hypothetical protein
VISAVNLEHDTDICPCIVDSVFADAVLLLDFVRFEDTGEELDGSVFQVAACLPSAVGDDVSGDGLCGALTSAGYSVFSPSVK